MLHREMVEHLARIDGRSCLRNQLGSHHGLPVPGRCVVDRDLEALLGALVRRVLVVSGHRDVLVSRATAMDIVLVWPSLVRPGPVVKKCC